MTISDYRKGGLGYIGGMIDAEYTLYLANVVANIVVAQLAGASATADEILHELAIEQA